MIAIVCGGRNYQLSREDLDLLDALPITAVYHGAAAGADCDAHRWAVENRKGVRPHPAKWGEHGHVAGPIRNAEMLRAAMAEAADQKQILIVVAFPGGRGTADMIYKAQAARVPVLMR